MSFRDILADLLQTTRGAIGAAFLDSEGESVEVASARPFDTDDHELRVIGAYAGIFLSHQQRIAEATGSGSATRFKIDFAASTIFCSELGDGYYLVLIADSAAVEGTAWRALERCRAALLAEM